jgi:DNA polymerase III subunit epsilon
VQRSFDDLGTPLHEVTFVVVDLETTGGSAADCAITEIGAVKLQGGACLGTFQTLVNPGVALPPFITRLTGITAGMLAPAPAVSGVLPAFLEFVGEAVVVGHNVRFDLAFLQAALLATDRPRLANRFVDTCALARRLVRDEVPDCTLATLAAHFRTGHRPTHRALDDALATGEVFHCLLERAGSLGVLGLDDLLELPTVRGHPMVAKLKLAARLPRRPGVYLFRDAGGRPLYVGRARDLRRRVRSYFSGDERRKVGALLREVQAIDHIECTSELEAAVREVRLIHDLAPRYNRQGTTWRRYAYVKLTLDERFPRLSVVRTPRPGDGCLYLGPLPSTAACREVVDAIHTASPIRRCTARPGAGGRPAPCAPAQLGVAACPCAGTIGEADYRVIVTDLVGALRDDPERLLAPLADRMAALAGAARFEEAAAVRDRGAALSRALVRQRRVESLIRAGRVTVELDGAGAVVERGRLVAAWGGAGQAGSAALPLPLTLADAPPPGDWPDGPLPIALADEVLCVAAWLERRSADIRLTECQGELAWPLPRLRRFDPAPQGAPGRRG